MRPELFSRVRFSDALVRQYLFPQALGGAMLSVDRPEYLYQANDTSTPVTGYSQPVGRILDQSGKGTHFGQGTTTSRPMRMQDAGGFSYLQVRTDDFFQSLANVDYSAAAYVTTVVAMKRQGTANSVLHELSAGSNANTFSVFLNGASTPGTIIHRSRGSGVSEATLLPAQTPAVGAPALLTTVGSVVADVAYLSINRIETIATLDQGTGSYAAALMYLFSRGGTSLFADLDFYAMLQIATAQPLTPQQLYLAQLWCASKMGVKP